MMSLLYMFTDVTDQGPGLVYPDHAQGKLVLFDIAHQCVAFTQSNYYTIMQLLRRAY